MIDVGKGSPQIGFARPPVTSYALRSFRRHPTLLPALLLIISCFVTYHIYQTRSPFAGLHNGFWSSAADEEYDPNLNGAWTFFGPESGNSVPSTDTKSNYSATVVMGRRDDNPWEVQWVHDNLVDITSKAIYIVDDPAAPLNLKRNKGREAMVYIKYIIDNYDHLNDVTFFFHASKEAWHNNVLLKKDSAATINNIRRETVVKQGYVNSRCDPYPGCPNWIKFNPTKKEDDAHKDRFAGLFDNELWSQLFPGSEAPTYLSEACCSQFAVSRETLRATPLETYERIHDWLGKTGVMDGYTGRIMEYVWQYLFLGKEQHCPKIEQCYCDVYGICLSDVEARELYEYNHVYSVQDNWGSLKEKDKIRFDGTKYNKFEEADDHLKQLRTDLPKKYGPFADDKQPKKTDDAYDPPNEEEKTDEQKKEEHT